MGVPVSDDVLAAAYTSALAHASRSARGSHELVELLTDAATDAVLWSLGHCTCATTFPGFARSAVCRWVSRGLSKAAAKRHNRPHIGALPEQVESRYEKPTQPLLMTDLPEDLAFVVRLYMIDGYNCRDIGLLTNQSHNTVNLKLKRAAEILAEGRIKPERRKGEKRLSAR